MRPVTAASATRRSAARGSRGRLTMRQSDRRGREMPSHAGSPRRSRNPGRSREDANRTRARRMGAIERTGSDSTLDRASPWIGRPARSGPVARGTTRARHLALRPCTWMPVRLDEPGPPRTRPGPDLAEQPHTDEDLEDQSTGGGLAHERTLDTRIPLEPPCLAPAPVGRGERIRSHADRCAPPDGPRQAGAPRTGAASPRGLADEIVPMAP